MDHQPPWNPQHGPLRTEQGDDFELAPFEEPPYEPNVPPGYGPTPAPGNHSGTGFSEAVAHGYYAGTTESALFNPSSAFGPAYYATDFPMQPNPTSNHMWNPTSPRSTHQPNPPTQFHEFGPSIWTPPNNWQVPNVSSSLGSHSFVTAQAAAPPGPEPAVLQSSPGFRSTFNQIAPHPDQAAFGMTSDMVPAETQQQHLQVNGRSTPGRPRDFIRRSLQRLTGSALEEVESCWRCRSDHKKCGPGTPCHRCATTLPSPVNAPIPCRRGQACDAAAEIPYLCHMPQGASKPLEGLLPSELQRAAKHLRHARQRRAQTARQNKGREPVAGCKYRMFCRVINTEVQNIRTYDPFATLDLIDPVELPYDERIADIVWELEDNPEAAQIMGIGSVEDLVALLEAACLCEAQFGHHQYQRRLVYASILCLLYCMEALRLFANGLLAADAHAACHEASECISPAFHGLTRYALRYAEALTTALFHKDRSKTNNWLLAFYSLCLQGHIRRGLMYLEYKQSTQLPAGGMEVEGFGWPLRSANYLQTAVSLFGRISMQSKGKLAKKIRDSRPRPSVYLQQPPHLSRPGGGGSASSSWQKWREHGIPEFLGSMFQIPIEDSTIHHPPYPTNPLCAGPKSDSDVTITSAPAPAPAPSPAPSPSAMATAQLVCDGFSNADGGSWPISSPGSTPEPSVIDSMWSETSYGESSDTSTFYAGSLAPSSAFGAGYLTPSMHSLSNVTLDEDAVGDDFWT